MSLINRMSEQDICAGLSTPSHSNLNDCMLWFMVYQNDTVVWSISLFPFQHPHPDKARHLQQADYASAPKWLKSSVKCLDSHLESEKKFQWLCILWAEIHPNFYLSTHFLSNLWQGYFCCLPEKGGLLWWYMAKGVIKDRFYGLLSVCLICPWKSHLPCL